MSHQIAKFKSSSISPLMAGTSNLCQQHLACFIDGTDSHFIPFGTMTTHNNEHTKNNNVKATGLCQETYLVSIPRTMKSNIRHAGVDCFG